MFLNHYPLTPGNYGLWLVVRGRAQIMLNSIIRVTPQLTKTKSIHNIFLFKLRKFKSLFSVEISHNKRINQN